MSDWPTIVIARSLKISDYYGMTCNEAICQNRQGDAKRKCWPVILLAMSFLCWQIASSLLLITIINVSFRSSQ